MAHFVKLSVLDPGHDDLENTTNRKYNPQLINLDMVINVEQSKVHSVGLLLGMKLLTDIS
jgi:hypothetical protein